MLSPESLVPQTMLSNQSVPQTMLSQATSAVPQTMLSRPHWVPQMMLSPQFAASVAPQTTSVLQALPFGFR